MLPVVLGVGDTSLSLGAIACESVEYVVITFQNTSKGVS